MSEKKNRRSFGNVAFPSAAEDAHRAREVEETPQTRSSAYRLAFTDEDFLLRNELRPIRLQLELLKPEMTCLAARVCLTLTRPLSR